MSQIEYLQDRLQALSTKLHDLDKNFETRVQDLRTELSAQVHKLDKDIAVAKKGWGILVTVALGLFGVTSFVVVPNKAQNAATEAAATAAVAAVEAEIGPQVRKNIEEAAKIADELLRTRDEGGVGLIPKGMMAIFPRKEGQDKPFFKAPPGWHPITNSESPSVILELRDEEGVSREVSLKSAALPTKGIGENVDWFLYNGLVKAEAGQEKKD